MLSLGRLGRQFVFASLYMGGKTKQNFLTTSFSALMSPTQMASSKEVSDYHLDFLSRRFTEFPDLTTKAIPDSDLAELKTQQALSTAWLSLSPAFPTSNIHVLPSVEHAVKKTEQIQSSSRLPIQILVSGSLHLVGGVIEVSGLSDVAL